MPQPSTGGRSQDAGTIWSSTRSSAVSWLQSPKMRWPLYDWSRDLHIDWCWQTMHRFPGTNLSGLFTDIDASFCSRFPRLRVQAHKITLPAASPWAGAQPDVQLSWPHASAVNTSRAVWCIKELARQSNPNQQRSAFIIFHPLDAPFCSAAALRKIHMLNGSIFTTGSGTDADSSLDSATRYLASPKAAWPLRVWARDHHTHWCWEQMRRFPDVPAQKLFSQDDAPICMTIRQGHWNRVGMIRPTHNLTYSEPLASRHHGTRLTYPNASTIQAERVRWCLEERNWQWSLNLH